MGSFDGAEVCKLIGLSILNELTKKFGKKNVGLYRDDGLTFLWSCSARLADKTRKELNRIFEQFGLKITVQAHKKPVNFLDVTFDLSDGIYHPYRKPNDEPQYISSHQSNHPSSQILKRLRTMTDMNKKLNYYVTNVV